MSSQFPVFSSKFSLQIDGFDPPRGLQFKGTAQLLTKQKDIDKAMAVYAGRIFPKEKILDL